MKGVYWLVMITILLGSGVLLANKYYEPKEKSEEFNVSISTEYNRKLIKTGVEIDGLLINTSTGYEIVKVNGGMIKIKNINIEEQSFYENEIDLNLTSNARVDLVLEKADLPELKVKDNGTITLILESDNFKEVDFCIRGSYNYIFIKAKNFNEVKKFKGYENYDICYEGGFSLNGNKEEIEISYTQFAEATEQDYMNITIMDYMGNSVTKTIK